MQAARNFFKAPEWIELTRLEREATIAVRYYGVGESNFVLGKVGFDLIAKTAWDLTRCAQANAASFCVKSAVCTG